ncbi:MAG: LysR family transcriptional regulator [Janthinobacterium lividum]
MSELTTARLRYLFEAVRLGGIRAAADFLNVAPSAVSRQLALLEKAARTPLLETNRRGAKPTEAGLLLIDHYRNFRLSEETLVSKLAGIHGMEYGNVAIGAIQGFTDDLMQHALREFNAGHPNLTISLRLGGVNDVLHWLEDDEVHLGLTYGPGLDLHRTRLRTIASVVQPICAVVPPGHALERMPSVQVRDLFAYPLALARPGYGTRDMIDRIELAEQRKFNVVLESDHLIALTSFVRAGMGITFLPAFAVHDHVERRSLCTVPVRHDWMQEVRADLLCRRGRELPAGAAQLQRLLVANTLAFKSLAI